MATELGSAFISVGLGTNSLAGDIKKAFGASGDVGEQAGKAAGSRFGGAVGIAAAAVGALGIGTFFKNAVSGAADLEQSVGAIDSVFKGSAGQMHEWAQSAATDVGLSANEFNELGTLIGSQLKNGGTAMDELGPKTKELISTGADLASMFGGTTSEAVDALSSALKGERDPIERYGVSLNQAKIDAEAAALGFGKVNGAFEQNAQQAATLSLITKQTADATGNFGRETDTLAHKQQVLNAQLANGKARIGTELLPVVAAFTGALSKALGPAINGTVTAIKEVVGGFTAFGAAFKAADGDITSNGFAGVMERIGFAASRLAIVGKTLWAGFKMDPEVAASFGAGLNPLLAFGQTVREIFDKVTFAAKTLWAGFKMPPEIAASFGSNLNPILALGQGFQSVVDNVVNAGKTLVAGFQMPLSVAGEFGTKLNPLLMIGVKVRETFSALGTALAGVWSAIGPQLAALVPQVFALFQALSPTSLIFQALLPVLPQIATAIGGVLAMVLPLVLSLTSALLPIVTQLVASVLPPLVDIFGNIVTSIVPLISIIVGALIPIIQALMPVVVTVFSVVADVIKNAMQIVQGIIQVVTGIISGNWGQVWEGIGNIFGGIWNTIVALVGGAIKIVGSVIQSGLGAVFGFIGDVLGNIGRFFADTWNNVTSGVGGFIGGLVGFFIDLPGKILGALGNLGSILLGAGQALIQGFIDGIKGMVGAIGDAVGGVLDFAKSFFPHSPAKRGPFSGRGYTSFSGIALATDFAKGIASQESLVASAASGLMGAASLTAAHSYSAGSYTPAGASRGPGSGITYNTTINQVDDPIGTSHAVQRRLGALAV